MRARKRGSEAECERSAKEGRGRENAGGKGGGDDTTKKHFKSIATQIELGFPSVSERSTPRTGKPTSKRESPPYTPPPRTSNSPLPCAKQPTEPSPTPSGSWEQHSVKRNCAERQIRHREFWGSPPRSPLARRPLHFVSYSSACARPPKSRVGSLVSCPGRSHHKQPPIVDAHCAPARRPGRRPPKGPATEAPRPVYRSFKKNTECF